MYGCEHISDSYNLLTNCIHAIRITSVWPLGIIQGVATTRAGKSSGVVRIAFNSHFSYNSIFPIIYAVLLNLTDNANLHSQ